MKLLSIVFVVFSLVLFTGCANQHRLGYHVALLKQQQTYNPSATKDNLDVIPTGNGERMEDAYSAYTGKKSESLQGASTSQVLMGFN